MLKFAIAAIAAVVGPCQWYDEPTDRLYPVADDPGCPEDHGALPADDPDGTVEGIPWVCVHIDDIPGYLAARP